MSLLLIRRQIARVERQCDDAKAKGDRPSYFALRRQLLNLQARLWELTRGNPRCGT